MLIDPFVNDWMEWLETHASSLANDRRLYLLLDGAFCPGLHHDLRAALNGEYGANLLFETLPGCSEAVRDVSPIVVPYVASAKFAKALRRCNGMPMMSAIATTENLQALSHRLAAWCIVEADDQHFNFRFPDTRRLPGIFEVLSAGQRAALAGPASTWHYIARDGRWTAIDVPQLICSPATSPSLSMGQFEALVTESEADEVLMLLQDRGRQWNQPHSKIYAQVRGALRVADESKLETSMRPDWCAACIEDPALTRDNRSAERLARWRDQNFFNG